MKPGPKDPPPKPTSDLTRKIARLMESEDDLFFESLHLEAYLISRARRARRRKKRTKKVPISQE